MTNSETLQKDEIDELLDPDFEPVSTNESDDSVSNDNAQEISSKINEFKDDIMSGQPVVSENDSGEVVDGTQEDVDVLELIQKKSPDSSKDKNISPEEVKDNWSKFSGASIAAIEVITDRLAEVLRLIDTSVSDLNDSFNVLAGSAVEQSETV